MKYLKLFEQQQLNTLELQEELEKFCNDHLAYLIDDNFHIRVKSWGGNRSKIYLSKLDTNNDKVKFHWYEIKDDFIAFYEMLKLKYKLFNYYTDEHESCYVDLNLNSAFSSKTILFDLYDKYIYSDTFEKRNILSLEIIVDRKL